MKKTYEEPSVEKLDFDYKHVITASGTAEADANTEKGNAYYYCACTPYYAAGWGQNC